MSEERSNWPDAVIWIVAWVLMFTLVILFAGSPDLMDAIVARVGGGHV